MKSAGYYIDMAFSCKRRKYPYFSDISVNDLACCLMIADNFDTIKSILLAYFENKSKKENLK